MSCRLKVDDTVVMVLRLEILCMILNISENKEKYSGYILFNFIAEKVGLPFFQVCVCFAFWGALTINFDRLLMKKLLFFQVALI